LKVYEAARNVKAQATIPLNLRHEQEPPAGIRLRVRCQFPTLTLRRGLLVGLQTVWSLGKIIFPITLITTILGFTPLIDWLFGIPVWPLLLIRLIIAVVLTFIAARVWTYMEQRRSDPEASLNV